MGMGMDMDPPGEIDRRYRIQDQEETTIAEKKRRIQLEGEDDADFTGYTCCMTKLPTKSSDQLYTENFVSIVERAPEALLSQYSLEIRGEDGVLIDPKGGIGKKLLDKLRRFDLSNIEFAYDGRITVFMIGGLPQWDTQFTLHLEEEEQDDGEAAVPVGDYGGDKKPVRRSYPVKTFELELSQVNERTGTAVMQAMRGEKRVEKDGGNEELKSLLRHAARSKKTCDFSPESYQRLMTIGVSSSYKLKHFLYNADGKVTGVVHSYVGPEMKLGDKACSQSPMVEAEREISMANTEDKFSELDGSP